MFKKYMIIQGLVLFLLVLQTVPALACGGPLSPGNSIQLDKAETLVGWHNGVEHYLTTFTYSGKAKNFGWVLSLPAVPATIEKGDSATFTTLSDDAQDTSGDWFKNLFKSGNYAASAPNTGAQVLQQTEINSLNISIIKGSGAQIIDWALKNGFTVDEHTRAHLSVYANGSPIFMAAKYDIPTSTNQKQDTGRNTPILLTMKTAHPWIPMELLAVDGQPTNADFYLLTDQPVNISSLRAKLGISPVNTSVPGATGLAVNAQKQLSSDDVNELRQQAGMSWVPQGSWLTYLTLSANGDQVTYDLGVSPSGIIDIAPFGTAPMSVVNDALSQELPGWLPALPPGSFPLALAGLCVVVIAVIVGFGIRRRRMRYAK